MQAIKLLLILAAVILLRVDSASADGFYLGAHGGQNLAHDGDFGFHRDASYKPGLAFGLTAGVKWSFGLRTEVELTFRSNFIASSKDPLFGGGDTVDTFVVMVNGFYDFDTGTAWIPYVGGGLGVLHNYVFLGSGDFSTLAIQLGVGVGYAVTETFIVSLDYRFLTAREEMTDIFFGLSQTFEVNNSTFGVALRFEF